jgi:hypothetical protein
MPHRNQRLAGLNVIPILQVFVYVRERLPMHTHNIQIHPLHPQPDIPLPTSGTIPYPLVRKRRKTYLPCLCLCFGFSEQIIYTLPGPFFPPFLRTLCTQKISLHPHFVLISHPSFSLPLLIPPSHSQHPKPSRILQSKERCRSYLTTTTQFLHRAPNLHPPHLLRDTLLYFHVCTIIPCSR